MECLKKLIEYFIDKPEAISAVATVTAALLTYKVAKSSEATAERSVQIAKDMRDMEVLNEGPKLYVKEIRKTGENTYTISMLNDGKSNAVNIDLANIEMGLKEGAENFLYITPSSGGLAHFNFEGDLLVLDFLQVNYQSVVGNHYFTKFTIDCKKTDSSGDKYLVINRGVFLM